MRGYSIMVFALGSVKVVTHKLLGFAVAGLVFILIYLAYFGVLAIPFLVFHVPTINYWEMWQRLVFGIGILVGFFLLLLRVFPSIAVLIEVHYPKTIQEGAVLSVKNLGMRNRQIVFKGFDGTEVILHVRVSANKLARALTLAEPR